MLNVCRGQAVTNTTTSATTMPAPGGDVNSGDDSREATTMEEDEYTDSSSVSSGSGDVIPSEPSIQMSEDEVMQIR